jgi:DNA-binding FrmR family transcriptional regulator
MQGRTVTLPHPRAPGKNSSCHDVQATISAAVAAVNRAGMLMHGHEAEQASTRWSTDLNFYNSLQNLLQTIHAHVPLSTDGTWPLADRLPPACSALRDEPWPCPPRPLAEQGRSLLSAGNQPGM